MKTGEKEKDIVHVYLPVMSTSPIEALSVTTCLRSWFFLWFTEEWINGVLQHCFPQFWRIVAALHCILFRVGVPSAHSLSNEQLLTTKEDALRK